MLYVLNFIAFLRNNFFNDLRITRFIGYSLRLSMENNPERFKQIVESLAFYGYMILTVLEIFIKSSFIVIIGYFLFKAPFINLDPTSVSSWKFADLFSKSRFYSYRPWLLNSSYAYRGFGSGNFPSEGAWIADDNDVVEAFYPRFLPYSKDFDHEDILLRPGGVGLRLKTRIRVLSKFDVLGKISANWTRHLLGSKRDRGPIKKISAPWHRLERDKLYFSRNKSLELKPSIHEPFSYYRSEDDCYPVSTQKGFLSRLYIPGFGSKSRKNLRYIPSYIAKDNEIIGGREMLLTSLFKGVNNIIEVQPYEEILVREAKTNNVRYDPTKDIYKEHREEDFERISDVLQSNWLEYADRVKDPAYYLSAGRFARIYGRLNSLVSDRGSLVSGYEFADKESAALNHEELTLLKYFRYLTNEPSHAEQIVLDGKQGLLLNRNTPYTRDDPRGENSPLYTYSFENKFSFVHPNLRGRHVYRRSLLDFIPIRILEYLRSFSNFFGFGVRPGMVNYTLDSSSSEDLFGFMINDREKFYKRVFRHGIVDDDNRPLQLRGRESFDLNYATVGSKFRFLLGDSFKVKERIPTNSFVNKNASDYKNEVLFFNKAMVDRRKVNTGIYVHEKLRSGGSSEDYKDFYNLGNVGFLNQYARIFYQFVLDHFTYWLRISLNYKNRNKDIPHFPSPASDIADKLVGLNPYTIFFKTLYFFRKYFRVLLFGSVSSKGVPGAKLGCESDLFTETSDFTLIALQKTLTSYIVRSLALASILILNAAVAGFSVVLDFSLNHFMASLFITFLILLSLFRVKYSYEFDFNKLFFKQRRSLIDSMYYFFKKVLQMMGLPFSLIAKSSSALLRVFLTGNFNPSRKPRESAELYYERLANEQQIMANIISFFKVDKIRRFLNRFGFFRRHKETDFTKGSEKSTLKVLRDFFYRRRSSDYKKVSLLKDSLGLYELFNKFDFLNWFARPLSHKRLGRVVPQRLRLVYFEVKEKVVYFSFEPTEEFLRIKKVFLDTFGAIRSLVLWFKGFAIRSGELGKRTYYQFPRKKVKNNFKKLVKFFVRGVGNFVNFIKWKLTEWINKQ